MLAASRPDSATTSSSTSVRRARRSSWSTGAGVIRVYGTLASMPASFSVEYEGRTVEVIPDAIWERDRVRLVVDGETVVERKANGKNTVLAGDGFEVRAVMPF